MKFPARRIEAARRDRALPLLAAVAVAAVAALMALGAAGLTLLARQAGVNAPAPAVLGLVVALLVVAMALSGLPRARRVFAQGPTRVARAMGARLLAAGTVDPLERGLLELIRELAVRCGTPVPAVFLLDQDTRINACVIGRRSGEAVLVCTRAALVGLAPEELRALLQQVMAQLLHGNLAPVYRLGTLVAGLRGGHDETSGRPWRPLGLTGWLAAWLLQALWSRRSAWRADAFALRLGAAPEALAGALRKAQASAAPPLGLGASVDAGRSRPTLMVLAMAHAWFVAPLRPLGGAPTHPSLRQRLRRIEALARLRTGRMASAPASDAWPLRWHGAAVAARDPDTAARIVLALLSPGEALRLQVPGSQTFFTIRPQTLSGDARQALLEQALASLHGQPETTRTALLRQARARIDADPRVSLLEIVLCYTLHERLGAPLASPRRASRTPAAATAALAQLIRAALDWHRSRHPRSLRSLTRAFERAGARWGQPLWAPPGTLDPSVLLDAIAVIGALPAPRQVRALKAVRAALVGDRNTPPEVRRAQAVVLHALCGAWGVCLPAPDVRVSERVPRAGFAAASALVYREA